MLALRVDLPTGRLACARHDCPTEPEDPPHPSRVYYSAVEALYAAGVDGAREAVTYLERLGPPVIYASPTEVETLHTDYLPTGEPAKGLGLELVRKPHQFPATRPEDPVLYYGWPDATPSPQVRAALDHLVRDIVHLGHTTGFVNIRVVDSMPRPTYVPDTVRGTVPMRVPYPGCLDDLDAAYDIHGGNPPRGYTLPTQSAYYRHVTPGDDIPGTEFSSTWWVVRKLERRDSDYSRLDVTMASVITQAFRDAVLRVAPNPAPESITGHAPDGSMSHNPHVAYVCLPFVGFEHADGHVIGVAAIMPNRTVESGEHRSAIEIIERVTSLHLGPLGVWDVKRDWEGEKQKALDPSRWASPSKTWMTATPIVLHRHPSHHGLDYYSEEMEAVVAEACVQVGLPEPTSVVLSPNSMANGVPPTGKFVGQPRSPVKRPLAHAVVRFAREVEGPVIIGAGRYMGYGLCVPRSSP